VRILAGGKRQMREISGASGYASQAPLTAVFGLGPKNVVDTLEVTWPASGVIQTLTDVACDQRLEIIEDYLSGISPAKLRPPELMLHECLPNPFSAATLIRYEIPATSDVSLAIYDASGRLVRNIIDRKHHEPGGYNVSWNGRDYAGRVVASGVYFCKLNDGSRTEVRRMVLLK
jgi:hypothetical protein